MNRLRHGTSIVRTRGRPVRAVDRHNHIAWTATWDEDRLTELVVRRPDRSELTLSPGAREHAVLGRVGAICEAGGPTLAVCGDVDWAAPRLIPPVDRPAAIPRGGGSAILNVLATLARDADEPALHYRGPYPTSALFDALLHSFTVTGDPAAARQRFTHDVEAAALRGEMRDVDVDFQPAPHEWAWPAPGVCVELRSGLERAFLRGQVFDRHAHRRLTPTDDAVIASVVIAGTPWCEVARFDTRGAVLDGPHALPAVDSPLVGTVLPSEIADVLASVIASGSATLLGPAIDRAVRQRTLCWGDTGDALAVADAERIRIHAVLGERLTELGSGQILAHLVDAVGPIARRLAQAALASAADRLY